MPDMASAKGKAFWYGNMLALSLSTLFIAQQTHRYLDLLALEGFSESAEWYDNAAKIKALAYHFFQHLYVHRCCEHLADQTLKCCHYDCKYIKGWQNDLNKRIRATLKSLLLVYLLKAALVFLQDA